MWPRIKLTKALPCLLVLFCFLLIFAVFWPVFVAIFIKYQESNEIITGESLEIKDNLPHFQPVGRDKLMAIAALSRRFLPIPRKIITQLPPCERKFLIGRINVDFKVIPFNETYEQNRIIEPGGRYRPKTCEMLGGSGKTAIIIPFRQRWEHLQALLNHLHPILIRQDLDYQIFVVEQLGEDDFNKGLLMNVGFKEALKEQNFDCFIFHDVDLFIEDDRAIYQCQQLPFHLSEFIDQMGYDNVHWGYIDILFGGVVAIPRRIFEHVNGYSNIYIGWGGEDDEMRYRLRFKGVDIVKPWNATFYRYKMLTHQRDKENEVNEFRWLLLNTTKRRMDYDGLNSLKYRIIDKKYEQIFTHFTVEYSKEEIFDETFGLQLSTKE